MKPIAPELLTRAQAGDAGAMHDVIDALSPTVTRFSRMLCHNDADAEEIAQDTLLAVTRSIAQFEGRSSLSSWVWTLARTACTPRKRSRKNQPHDELPDANELTEPAPRADDLAAQAQLEALVRRTLALMPDEYRQAIELRDVNEHSAPEAAAQLGISVEAFKSRLHRARGALRDRIQGIVAPEPGCEDLAAMISRRLEGELDPVACARLREQVYSCDRCRTQCEMLRNLYAACIGQA
jgi:RNA polymerase sigma-70 factor (ECF subfamily)